MLAVVVTFIESCRTVATPTFPAIPTNTPTITPTLTNTPIYSSTATRTPTQTPTPTISNTATNSPTSSATNSPTVTNTPGGPTETNSPTNTETNTPTVTGTPTNSPTITPTNSPTNTPACSSSPLSAYTFDSCPQGWTLDGTVPGGETISQSSTTFHTGPGAWEGIINFDATNNSEEININFPCGTFQNLEGAAVTAWVYSTVAGNAQMFCNYGTGPAACYAGYQNPGYCGGTGCVGNAIGNYATLAANTWTMVTFKTSLTAPDAQYVSKFGINILGINSPATIYVDDVTITTLATPTPTPAGCVAAPTFNSTYPFIWNNDNYCTLPSGWSSNNNSGTIVVPSLLLSTLQNHTIGCSSTCGSLLMGPIPFTAANQVANVEYVFPNTTGGTDITGKTISAWYYLDAAPSNAGYGQMYIQDGVIGGYNYQSLGFGGTYALTIGAWTQISIPANQGGVDPTGVWKFGIQIGTGASAISGFQNVNLYVDDMTIQ